MAAEERRGSQRVAVQQCNHVSTATTSSSDWADCTDMPDAL